MKLNTSNRKRFRVSNKVKRVAGNDRFRLNISKSILILFFPWGPSMFKLFPAKATFTFSGIEILVFPILDIKIPYRLFPHQYVAF